MSNVVSYLFICNLKKCFLNHQFGIHAELPGQVIFPNPAFCLREQLFAWHKVWTVGRKEYNHCSCGMNPVNYRLCMMDGRVI